MGGRQTKNKTKNGQREGQKTGTECRGFHLESGVGGRLDGTWCMKQEQGDTQSHLEPSVGGVLDGVEQGVVRGVEGHRKRTVDDPACSQTRRGQADGSQTFSASSHLSPPQFSYPFKCLLLRPAAAGDKTVLGTRQCWGQDSAGDKTMLGTRQCWGQDSAGDCDDVSRTVDVCPKVQLHDVIVLQHCLVASIWGPVGRHPTPRIPTKEECQLADGKESPVSLCCKGFKKDTDDLCSK